jgi:hypothetical protein
VPWVATRRAAATEGEGKSTVDPEAVKSTIDPNVVKNTVDLKAVKSTMGKKSLLYLSVIMNRGFILIQWG